MFLREFSKIRFDLSQIEISDIQLEGNMDKKVVELEYRKITKKYFIEIFCLKRYTIKAET